MGKNIQPEFQNMEAYEAVKKSYLDKGYNIVELDGNTILSKFDIFRIFYEKLKFPNYFGNNWDALFDCLKDLGWLENKNTVVLIKNLDDREIFKILLHQLAGAKEIWKEYDREYGEKADIEAIKFK